MIGARVGIKVGARVGEAVGIGADEISSGTSSAPPTFGAAGTTSTATVGVAQTPGLPAGTVAGSYLLLVVNNTITATTDATLSDAQGFTAIVGGAVNSGDFGGARSHQTLFHKIATGTDAAPTVAANGEFSAARIFRFEGVRSAAPINVLETTGDNSGDASVSINGDTTTTAQCLVVAVLTSFDNSVSATVGSWANASLANVTERADVVSDVTTQAVGIALTTGEKAVAGAFGATTATWSTGVYWIWAGIMLALNPA